MKTKTVVIQVAMAVPHNMYAEWIANQLEKISKAHIPDCEAVHTTITQDE